MLGSRSRPVLAGFSQLRAVFSGGLQVCVLLLPLQVLLSNGPLWGDLLGSRDFGKSQQRCQKGAMKTSNLGWTFLLGHVWLFAIPWTAACQASLSFTVSWSLPKFCSLSWWCYLSSSFSVARFSFCPQSFPPSGSFPTSQLFASYPVSQLFASGGQNVGTSTSATVLSIVVKFHFLVGNSSSSKPAILISKPWGLC